MVLKVAAAQSKSGSTSPCLSSLHCGSCLQEGQLPREASQLHLPPLVQRLLTLFQICQSHKSCEIDPVKLKDGENLENNMVRHLLCSGTLPKAGHLVGILLMAVWALLEDLSQGGG